MKEKQVVIGAKHPVIGMLYLEVIRDGEVGLVDIYRVTESISGSSLVFHSPDWRLHEPEFYRGRNPPWHEAAIDLHLSMIRWHEDKEVSRICAKYNVLFDDLQKWATDVQHWVDVPVMVDVDGGDSIFDIELIGSV